MTIPWYQRLARSWQLWVLILPALIYLVVFRYFPMYGALMAFQDFDPSSGIFGSTWVGLQQFEMFLNSYVFIRVLANTLFISLLTLVIGFPFPIILALMLNSLGSRTVKKTVQMTTYLPYFISTVVMVTIIMEALHPRSGIITLMVKALGFPLNNAMGDPNAFVPIYIISGLWQTVGYSSIIYIAALSSVDPCLYEAATIDGASKFQKIWYIDIPTLIPTAVILLILNIGRIMSLGFEKIYLMQNNLNLQSSEVISTYVYKVGLLEANFSFGTAVGLFDSVINLSLLLLVNQVMKKYNGNGLW